MRASFGQAKLKRAKNRMPHEIRCVSCGAQDMETRIPTSVEVHTLTMENYESIVELWRRAGLSIKPKGRDSRQMIEKQMQTLPECFIGAFYEGRLVGVVIGSYDGRMKGWINRLAVDPAWRRRGIAEQLISRAEEALKKRGAAIFCALIETPNEESAKLFRKMGYVTHKEILYVTKRESEEA
jgi:ribosomal protein S18 acetylase RimI-like enzyme